MKKFLTIVGIIGALFIGTFFGANKESVQILGNAEAGNQSTTTSRFINVTSGSQRALKTVPGVLHNVIITNESVGTYTLKNATSSTDIASTTIIIISPSMIEGSHAIDAAFDRGLFIDHTSTNVGSSTITWN